MTVIDAEKLYQNDVNAIYKKHEVTTKKIRAFLCVFGVILFLVGLIVLMVGLNKPPIIDSLGYETDDSFLERLLGSLFLALGGPLLLYGLIVMNYVLRRGPENFLPAVKHLYMNYIRCEDMNDNDKEFYKQKLEEIRYVELSNAIRQAGVSVSVATLYSSIHRK